MVTMVTMSKRLSFSIFCSSQIVLAHQPVHVRMTWTILLNKQLSDCSIFAKKWAYFQGRFTEVLGVKQVVS